MIDIEFSAHFYYHHYQAKQGREGRERIKMKEEILSSNVCRYDK